MINHDKVLNLLKKKQYTQDRIAQECNCSISTVRRIARQNDLLPGQGNRRFWIDPKPSPELAYIIGMFITDGTIGLEYKTKRPRQLTITSTTTEICDKLLHCYSVINLPVKLNGPYKQINEKHKDQFVVAVYWSAFARWMREITDSKNKIPDFILNAPKLHQIEFLSGAIDGDGSVTKYGSIKIRNIEKWLADLPYILNNLGIKTTGHKPYGKPLITGNIYYVVTVNRTDFAQLSPQCAHPIKQYRILNPEKRTEYTKRKPTYIECLICGIKRMSPKAKRCEQCYRESEQFQQHLETIAKKGNRAGNIARWGTKHLNKHS